MLRAIVFDFDGVLANSEPLHFEGFRDVLADEGITLTRDDYYARYLGYDDAGVFQAIAGERGVAWTTGHVGDLVARKAVRLEALERDTSLLFPGAAAAVRRAAAAVPIAIASGAIRADIHRVLDRERLTTFFTAIVAAEDTPLSKPAPDPYLRAWYCSSQCSAGASTHANASPLRIRTGASRPRAPQDCEPSASRTPTTRRRWRPPIS